jgi:H+/gluconate symporter-like permease
MDAGVISLIGIIIGLAGLMYLAFKGTSLLIVGPLMSLVTLLFAWGSINPVEGLLGPYSTSFANFAKNNFLLFLLSSIFGKMTGDSGAGKTIAVKMVAFLSKIGVKDKRFATVMIITVITMILTMGGISSFVVIFTMVSIMKPLFEELDIPWHLSLAGIAFGAQTITATMIPGSPAIQNLIPTQYLGTTPKAAPMLGILCAIVTVVLCIVYVKYAVSKTVKKNEGFLPTGAGITEYFSSLEKDKQIDEVSITKDNSENESFLKAITPSAILLICLNALNLAPIVALALGNIASYILYKNKYKNVSKTLTGGAENAVRSIIGVCAVVGFGGVVNAVPGYQLVVDAMGNLPGPPIVQLVVAANIIAGITGSASGGLGIALDTMAERFLDMGIHPEIIHRMSAMSSYGLDSLPHNGSVINMLNVSRLTHAQAYGHTFWLTVVIPVFVSVFSVIFVQMGIM